MSNIPSDLQYTKEHEWVAPTSTALRIRMGITDYAQGELGERGVLAASELGERFALVERLWFGSAGMRIAGGTDEIVKNSIGERVLGLAPEPRTDKGVPFNELSS